jgi:hypothetical protein
MKGTIMNRLLWGAIGIFISMWLLSGFAYAAPRGHQYSFYDSGEVVSHPAGCPYSLFCGCGASVEVYGHPVRNLYLADNWLAFPRASCAPGMAVVWPGRHVAVIRSCEGDGIATLYDANSGGGLTRVHKASLAGGVIVDPHGSSQLAFSGEYHETHHTSRVAYRNSGNRSSNNPQFAFTTPNF